MSPGACNLTVISALAHAKKLGSKNIYIYIYIYIYIPTKTTLYGESGAVDSTKPNEAEKTRSQMKPNGGTKYPRRGTSNTVGAILCLAEDS